VTLNRSYAVEHGRSNLNNRYKILTKTVRAKDLWTDGNSLLEWGYTPAGSGVRGLPKPASGLWPCEYVPLRSGACPTPPAKNIDLSGLRGRGRYRLTTVSRRR
jgi:hypothetical protein